MLFTGITLAIGVSTWIFSPLKFQADMGLLLAFLFLMNMIGALVLLPALLHFLLRRDRPDGVRSAEHAILMADRTAPARRHLRHDHLRSLDAGGGRRTS